MIFLLTDSVLRIFSGLCVIPISFEPWNGNLKCPDENPTRGPWGMMFYMYTSYFALIFYVYFYCICTVMIWYFIYTCGKYTLYTYIVAKRCEKWRHPIKLFFGFQRPSLFQYDSTLESRMRSGCLTTDQCSHVRNKGESWVYPRPTFPAKS